MNSGGMTRQPDKCFSASFSGRAHLGRVAIFLFPSCARQKQKQASAVGPEHLTLHH